MRQICRQLIHIFAFYVIGIAGYIWADTEEQTSPRSQAVNHVQELGGIAVLVSVGSKDAYTGDQVGQAVIKKFQSMHDVEMTYFTRQAIGDFGYLEFYMKNGKSKSYGGDAWDTPEEVKSLFDRMYLAYLNGLKAELKTDIAGLKTERDQINQEKAQTQHFLDEISKLLGPATN